MLIIRTGGLGDSLLLWPAVTAVRRRFPGAHIALLGARARLLPLVCPGGADAAHEGEGSGLHLLMSAQPVLSPEAQRFFGGFDTVVAFSAARDGLLAENLSLCGAAEVHAFLPLPAPGEPRHLADHLLDALCGVDLAQEGPPPPLPVTAAAREAAARRLGELGLENRELLAILPGSGSAAKNWDAAHFATLAATLREEGLAPILFEGPADRAAVAETLAQLRPPAPPVLRDDPPLTLAGLFERCRLVIGNDSGPTHLAALLGRPTLAIFGPTDPRRSAPRGARVAVLRAGLPCSPCADEQMHDCPERECLRRVTPAEVLEAARRFL